MSETEGQGIPEEPQTEEVEDTDVEEPEEDSEDANRDTESASEGPVEAEPET